MATNLFTYNVNSMSLTNGIALAVGARGLNNKPLPPHLSVGEWYIQVDRAWSNPPALLTSAGLKTCYTPAGKPFNVFQKAVDQNDYVLIDVSPVAGVKPHYSAEAVNAFEHVVCDFNGEIIFVDRMLGSALVSLPCEYAQVEVWRRDGTIHQLVRRGGRVVRTPLSMADVIKKRVAQLDGQLQGLNQHDVNDLRKAHGIIAGAIRLAKHADHDALSILTDFLLQYREQMTQRLRADVRQVLQSKGSLWSGVFTEYGGNVVSMGAVKRPNGVPQDRRLALAARAERDRAARNAMRGDNHNKK